MKPDVRAFFDEDTNTVTYVVTDLPSKVCTIIDPVLDFDQASGRTSTESSICACLSTHFNQEGLDLKRLFYGS